MIDRRGIRIPIFLSLIILLAGISARPMQQVTGGGDWYFPETKKLVSGEILDYYEHTEGYMVKFGFPISNLEDHPVLPGVKVQYFQRARIELYPNDPPDQRIHLASLGVWLYGDTTRGKPADLPYSSGACRMFTQYNIGVCYDFLKFYDENHGEIYFGEPISVMETMPNGRLVQYFERARMEWWPENPTGNRVILTNLGMLYYMQEERTEVLPGGVPPDIYIPQQGGYQLKVHAFTAKPLVGSNSKQTVYVIVTDQTNQPVKGALVEMVMRLPNGDTIKNRLLETKDNGLTSGDFDVTGLTPNQVIQVDVKVSIPDGVSSSTSVYFRTWY